MFKFSSKLWYNKRCVSADGYVSLYLQVVIDRSHKEFPLKLRWPANLIDLQNGELLPRSKRDQDVTDYNLLIKIEQGKHTEILRTYRIRKSHIDVKIFASELKTFDYKESFVAYMRRMIQYRYQIKDIDNRTRLNSLSSVSLMVGFDFSWLFTKVDHKFLKRFKQRLLSDGNSIGHAWTTIKNIKCYLRLASKEALLSVHEDAVVFPNPLPDWRTIFLNLDEVRRLVILYRSLALDNDHQKILAAFLFTCFTSLRISDVYRVNAKWRINNGFLDFIPKKNQKKQRWVHVPIMPIANQFIENTAGQYFNLPTEQEYNRRLKTIAAEADINKHLTSHVGRHTFGYLYMTSVGNLKGLQEIMGHRKIETTMRYAHLDDDYLTNSVMQMQSGFNDLLLRKI